MFTEQQNLDIVRTSLDGVFYPEFNYDDSNPRIARAMDASLFMQTPISNQAYIEEIFQGVGLFQAIGETQNVPNEAPHVTNNKYITAALDFAKEITISKNLFDDNMHGVWAESVKDFGYKAKVSIDANAFGVYRNAFSTQLTADGVSLVNPAHIIKNGTTSNYISGALNHPNFFNGITALAQQVDQAGVVLGHQAVTLLVPPALLDTAIQETDSALYADNSNNGINVIRSAYGITIKSNPYIAAVNGGSDTAWFLLARKFGVRRVIRQGLETFLRPWGYSSNRTYVYQANFREAASSPSYEGLVASPGF